MKKCIICEKDLPPIDDNMSENIEGGTMDIDFGYGSQYDTNNSCCGNAVYFHIAICDQCFKKKKHLGYWISLDQTWKKTILSEDEVYGG